MTRPVTVLTIAGSDGSAGAGIQADLKTIGALGGYALTVITAITEQSTAGVRKCWPVEPACARGQFDALAADIEIDAVKIGMLGNGAMIETVAELLGQLAPNVPIVLDTILRSTSGAPLLEGDALPAFLQRLVPMATLITPNLPETAALLGLDRQPSVPLEIEEAAAQLRQKGARAVLVKGGHAEGATCRDYLLHQEGALWLEQPRIETQNTHGTGCTLSSAIATLLGMGKNLEEAVQQAKQYLTAALQAGKKLSIGHGPNRPMQHLF